MSFCGGRVVSRSYGDQVLTRIRTFALEVQFSGQSVVLRRNVAVPKWKAAFKWMQKFRKVVE